jgi:ferredoxin
MNVRVDADLCIGCELCVQTAPSLFEMSGDKAIAKVSAIPESEETSCKDAADSCPVSAIIME